MRFSLAEFWGGVTLLAAIFAAFRFLTGTPEAIGATILFFVPLHGIIVDLVEHMSRSGHRGKRIV